MNSSDLRAALASAPDGAEVHIDSGEFEGPWVVERRLRLVGNGGSSVLWAPHGPALLVKAGGVHLQAIAIEVTQQEDGVALAVAANVAPPSATGVRVLGRVEGIGPDRQWRLPKSVDFGVLAPGSCVRRSVGLQLPGEIGVRSELEGLVLRTERVASGELVLHMQLDATNLPPRVVIDGRIEVEACGLLTWMRLTGRVAGAAPPAAPPEPEAGGPLVTELRRAWRDLSTAGPPSGAGPPPALAPAAASRPAGSPAADIGALLTRAQAALAADDLDAGAALIEQALHAAPRHSQANALRARTWERQGAYAEAAAAWRRVLGLDPAFSGAHLRLARCLLQLNDFDAVVTLLEAVRQQDGNARDPEFLKTLAQGYFNSHRSAEALQTLELAEAATPRPDPRLRALRAVWTRQAEGR